MAIVKQTLHPEGDTGTDIYPKTSTDQIEDLPISAQKQLYGHYLHITGAESEGEWLINVYIFFINSIKTPISSISGILGNIKGSAVTNGMVKKDISTSGINCWASDMYISESNVYINYFAPDDTGVQSYDCTTNPSALTFTCKDNVVAIGSNAG